MQNVFDDSPFADPHVHLRFHARPQMEVFRHVFQPPADFQPGPVEGFRLALAAGLFQRIVRDRPDTAFQSAVLLEWIGIQLDPGGAADLHFADIPRLELHLQFRLFGDRHQRNQRFRFPYRRIGRKRGDFQHRGIGRRPQQVVGGQPLRFLILFFDVGHIAFGGHQLLGNGLIPLFDERFPLGDRRLIFMFQFGQRIAQVGDIAFHLKLLEFPLQHFPPGDRSAAFLHLFVDADDVAEHLKTFVLFLEIFLLALLRRLDPLDILFIIIDFGPIGTLPLPVDRLLVRRSIPDRSPGRADR